MARKVLAVPERIIALLALVVGHYFGHFFHRRRSLPEDREEQESRLPALSSDWDTDQPWYRSGFPPRRHNRIHPLPHGAEYFADLCRALEEARTRVTIAGWCLTPWMDLRREEAEAGHTVAEILHDASLRADVYVLLWSGAPAVFRPSVQNTEQARDNLLQVAPRVHCELDRRASFSHDHHQKAVTIDGRVAYVGGIDLTTFQGDRWDFAAHPLRFGPNWHDVQMRLQGEVVRDVEENFCQRWNAVTGQDLQPLEPQFDTSWVSPAQIVRTVPAGFYPFAENGEYGIRHALLAAIERAEHFIYLENQYLWAPEIVEALIAAMNRPHSGPFRIILVLPARAYTGKYDNDDHVRALRSADNGRGIFEAFSLYSAGPAYGLTGYRYLPIYVHAKVSIVDDRWASVGSANLNRRGLATDTEMNVQTTDPSVARVLRVKLWAEHLGLAEEAVAEQDPIKLIDEDWRAAAKQMAAAARAGGPPCPGNLMPYVPGSNPGSRLLDLMQAVTLEH